VTDTLHIHEPIPPQELLSRACEHDVGLALETEHSLNRRLTVTNKVFLYMTAGLAVAASDTSGQRSIMSAAPGAGALHPVGDHAALAAQLRHWQNDARSLVSAKANALEAARVRWNAESEGRVVVNAIDRALARERTTLAVG
jgi:hypothetical protein